MLIFKLVFLIEVFVCTGEYGDDDRFAHSTETAGHTGGAGRGRGAAFALRGERGTSGGFVLFSRCFQPSFPFLESSKTVRHYRALLIALEYLDYRYPSQEEVDPEDGSSSSTAGQVGCEF